ncbi:MAG TPA: Crp/Fnr family transcriptional regulator [Chitinophagaceae bacterium]|nr:Crp/Fnr family transcriptional regulator [Chitinophagaceae bacterium]
MLAEPWNRQSQIIFSFLILTQLEQLLDHIKNYYQLSPEAQHALHDCFEQVVVNKNEYLLNEGKICRHLYFVQQGALRGYYTLDGKEITHWFGFEKDFVTSFHSFITQEPAVENIQLLEGSVLWVISKDTLSALFNQYHEIERLVRIAYEKYYIRLEERFVNAHFKTATERYESLFKEAPHILERVPLGHIASYLGISQETLSRIRSKL